MIKASLYRMAGKERLFLISGIILIYRSDYLMKKSVKFSGFFRSEINAAAHLLGNGDYLIFQVGA